MSATALEYWSGYQVADFGENVTAAESWRMIHERNLMYPHLDSLMPTDLAGLRVLDFGCGPGHDTIQFITNGAKHVYAADVSAKALAMVFWRLRAHGYQDQATILQVEDPPRDLPKVDYIHTAGVIHHVADPVGTLSALATALLPRGEIRMMVYSADSWFYREKCGGDPDVFRLSADPGSPISHAWTAHEVRALALLSGLHATQVGSYRDPCEPKGAGLMSCWSLRCRQ